MRCLGSPYKKKRKIEIKKWTNPHPPLDNSLKDGMVFVLRPIEDDKRI